MNLYAAIDLLGGRCVRLQQGDYDRATDFGGDPVGQAEAWEAQARKLAPVQFVLSLDRPLEREGRCYWPVEARSGGKTWHTFYATPRGEHLLVAGTGGALLTLEDWRKTTR